MSGTRGGPIILHFIIGEAVLLTQRQIIIERAVPQWIVSSSFYPHLDEMAGYHWAHVNAQCSPGFRVALPRIGSVLPHVLAYSGINRLVNVFRAYCVFLFHHFCLDRPHLIKNSHYVIENWQHLPQNLGTIT